MAAGCMPEKFRLVMAAALVEVWSQYVSVNLTCILAVLAGVAVFVWYWCGYLPYQYFKNLGIPGPTPLPFIGNLHQVKSELFDFKDLCNKYGDVCGFYIGHTPVLVIGNPEMAKEVTIKQSANFIDRSACSGIFCAFHDGVKYLPVLSDHGESWKKSRQIMSPTFSTHKLKSLEPQVKESVTRLAERIAEAEGKSVDIVRWYRELTSEVILSTVLGQRVKVQQGEGSELFNCMEATLETAGRSRGHFSFLLQIGAAMSWISEYLLVPLTMNHYTAFGRGSLSLMKAIHKVMVRNKENEQEGGPEELPKFKNKSILQQMADASSRASDVDSFQDGQHAANAYVLILAGHETTSSALAYTSYLLALHPEVQERLAEEIDNYLREHPDESLYDAAQNIEYLDMVWQESLRMYPPAGMFIRRCNKDTVVNGIPIKEGYIIAVSVQYMHHSNDYWADPETFNPERFSKSQKSSINTGAFIPFGSGPRYCIGMRLAIMEAKMTLIEVLSKFRIVKAPETKVPLELEPSTVTCFKDTVYLRFEGRQ